MVSKSLELADYSELHDGLRDYNYGVARCTGARIPLALPHPHRAWEYASTFQAIRDVYHGEAVTLLDVGCGDSLLGPTAAMRLNCYVHEFDPLDGYADIRPRINDALGLPAGRHTFEVADLLTYTGPPRHIVTCISVVEHIKDHNEAWGKLSSLVLPGGLLVVTTDYNVDASKTWANDHGRECKYTPQLMSEVSSILECEGFVIDMDTTFHDANVFDYTFFRVIARKV